MKNSVRNSMFLLIAGTLVLGAAGRAGAEVFVLAGGGRVEGKLLNPDQIPRTTYDVETPEGARVSLALDQVKEVIRQRPEQIEYASIRHGYPDTVDGQWELAEWCREHTLLTERKTHLERIIELDPDNQRARRALGYTRVGGKWMTQKERMIAEGYRRYQGRWRTQQEIDIIEADRQKKLAEGEWMKRMKMWRDWLDTERHQAALANIEAIDDPAALKALAYALKEDHRDQARLLYIAALARIDTLPTRRLLALWATQDSVKEVRLTCLDHLSKRQEPEILQMFTAGLTNKDNGIVNRAAECLEHLKNPAAVAPLIDALVTTHKYKITSGGPDQMSSTFSNQGGGGFTAGSSTTIISREMNNRAVLDALVSLTGGVDFSFDEARWKAWYATQMKTRPELDARRD